MSGVVVITGGGRGIGAATALACASAGFDVCLCYRADESAANAVVAACSSGPAPGVGASGAAESGVGASGVRASGVGASGVRALAVRADVGVEADVLALFEAAASLGPLAGLVNNAGVTAPAAPVTSFTAVRIEHVLRVNVLGAFLCAREAVRRMGGGGSIVNVSSRAAVLGGANEYVDYAASKAALDALTTGLALEVAGQGIRVNAVRPGLIDTEIHATTGRPDRVRELSGTVPMGRGGRADEVAAAIVWLLSPAASFVTGAFLDVSGGR